MYENLLKLIQQAETADRIGKIENVVGMSMEASGGRSGIGDIVMIYNEAENCQVPAEVVGFKNGKIQLMTYENISGITAGSFVRNTGCRLQIPVGDFLKGRIINALGHPIDEKGEFPPGKLYTVDSAYINPLNRPPIREHLEFGIKAIDGLNTIGKGQRMGIFAGSGVGKSTLMGMIARNVKTDINVIALVGERGREVLEFVKKDLGEEGMKRSVLLLMMDSLTRYAMAQREIGLAIGEPPIARGYTPSIYAEFPRLLERSGNFAKGSITGIYTVLVEGDYTNEPVADTVRGILDGHIVLSRQLANANHFPAIDISASISRLMNDIAGEEHRKAASRFRNMLSLYQKNADLISIGAYKKGANSALDEAVDRIGDMNKFLEQETNENIPYEESIRRMEKIVG